MFKRLKCNHVFETISNFYGDYINDMSGKNTVRSRVKCKKCGKEKLLRHLDKDCNIINDEYYNK